jgi:SOS-response transcriptional repressor LexA
MFIAAPPLSRETMNRVVGDSRPLFTPRQGQYLAFIYAYTLVNGRPPAQADMQRFFRLTPPSVHQMLVALERAGLISRQPGVARSIAVLVDRSALPDLEPGYGQPVRITVQRYSHVRRFKQQAQKIFTCPSSCSAWPPPGKAGGTIMKRRLIML